MSEIALERECEVFTHVLVGRSPTPYVLGKYVEAHGHRRELTAAHPVDIELLRIARRSPGWCRLADALAVRVRRTGTLRAKLIVLVAILETTPPFYQLLDRPVDGRLPTMIALGARGVRAVVLTLVAVVLLAPRLGLARLTRTA